MRVLMLSWEFPPLVVGGLAAHVDGLSRALARQGHQVVVLTLHHDEAPDDTELDGVRVLRARADLPWMPDDNFLAQMATANHQLVKLTAKLGSWRPDVVHAHDWLVAWAGDTIRTLWDQPLVATIHATEKGRNHGHLPPGQSMGIHAVEWWLTYQARRVIACSDYMVAEVVDSFVLPPAKVDMVPNGVDAGEWSPPPGVRRDPALIVSWGRVQYEKGFQTLVGALPDLRHRVPGVRAIIAGKGSYVTELQHQATRLGVGDLVRFAGFVTDAELRRLLHTCGCAVIPSLYEPFGIVALEALAAGAPLVAAASGGLAEVLGGTEAALLYPAGDSRGLADAATALLTDHNTSERCRKAGDELVRGRYSWDSVAHATVPVYEAAQA